MMNFAIKNELTEKEFSDLFAACDRNLGESDDLKMLIKKCSQKTREITPAQEVFLLRPDPVKPVLTILSTGEVVPRHPHHKGILSEVFQTKQAFILNDVHQSFLYQDTYDNITQTPITNLMVIPILSPRSSHEILAILWAAIPKGDLNQYTQLDLSYMTRFSTLIARLFQHHPHTDHTHEIVEDYQDAYTKLRAQIRREREYFSSIIHDIRTPMNGVIGFLELLNLHEEDPKKQDYITSALMSGEGMVALINDALDIAKISSGKMEIERAPFAPLEVFSDTAKLFVNSTRKRGITLGAYYDPHLPMMIQSDYHRIKQIMNNLLNNAIKFTPKDGHIDLEVLYDAQHDGLQVSIRDTGIGIAKERQEMIFNPYTQEKSSTSRQYGGTGLGLSISQQLVVLLGGVIGLESEEGVGSRFYFDIPCHTPPDTPPSIAHNPFGDRLILIYTSSRSHPARTAVERYLEAMDAPYYLTAIDPTWESVQQSTFDLLVITKEDLLTQEEYAQEILDTDHAVLIIEHENFLDEHNWFVGDIRRIAPPILPDDLLHVVQATQDVPSTHRTQDLLASAASLAGLTVLIVDDNTINLHVTQEILATVHVPSIVAQSGAEGIESFVRERPDVILMDENMPELTGSEAIRQIRALEAQEGPNHTPIISLTGYSDPKTKERIQNAGADLVLTKPTRPQEIIQSIQKYFPA